MRLFLIIILTSSVISLSQDRTIIFIGDSLTEGYGIAKDKSFPNLLSLKLKDKGITVINAGVSGSTTATGVARLRWFGKRKPEIVVIALGSNDGLRGVKVSETEKNLRAMIKYCQERKMKVVLLGTRVPHNYGKEFRDEFNQMFRRLSQIKEIVFMPFLLEDVATVKELNQDDGIHPNEKGHELMTKNIYPYILKAL